MDKTKLNNQHIKTYKDELIDYINNLPSFSKEQKQNLINTILNNINYTEVDAMVKLKQLKLESSNYKCNCGDDLINSSNGLMCPSCDH